MCIYSIVCVVGSILKWLPRFPPLGMFTLYNAFTGLVNMMSYHLNDYATLYGRENFVEVIKVSD